ncbi:hypothetical protein SKAU_G00076030 [Synaphobranchus kaupii]|uniref:G-protein coupled receptors family 2 profile 2 domain-containing protein n=1 Tax=Synaphobranchus kaupii TaxID=118154 RepID=A0A9Q1G8M7_SYNKA|nr:hypothetical protein SKAU_G00076030 [Synaphobranchus kaupii]
MRRCRNFLRQGAGFRATLAAMTTDQLARLVVETTYYDVLLIIKQVYTAGYATSLISLITAIFVFTVFRKFHCTRNYIHMNLFASFILRASSVFIKDGVLFADETMDHCLMSSVSCKSAMAFFQFCILANYFWLLVEGMYLQTLLALTFVSQKKYFWWYILIGWGLPTSVLTVWVLTRYFYDDRGCWDTENTFIWWIIKGPITASLLVNFIIFINVIRILVQKLKSPGVGGRLAKSTLFLIPLFGMHYTVFAFLPENTGEAARLYIELGLGSFQGFVVALLYCFLNGEVQAEMKKRLWKWQMQGYLSFTKRRRTLFTETSTVTQISVLEKSSPKDLLYSECQHNGGRRRCVPLSPVPSEAKGQRPVLVPPRATERHSPPVIGSNSPRSFEQNFTVRLYADIPRFRTEISAILSSDKRNCALFPKESFLPARSRD